MHIPSRWAVSHDCELHYSLAEQSSPQSRYICEFCGGTTYLHPEQWADMQARVALKRAAIEAIPLESPERRDLRTNERQP